MSEMSTNGHGAGSAPLLQISDLRVDFRQRGQVVRAVDGLSYTVGRARTVALIGESGSGKTVSSRAIMGLLPHTAKVSGSIRFEGTELVGLAERRLRRYRGGEIAMIFQDPSRSLNPTIRIGPQITEAIHLHGSASRAQAHDRAVELMELVRLPAARERFRQYPHQLSGGMRQRVMIAICSAVSAWR
jgi:ABC-type dipeptide/oligopeptide/nickel transport system ATPase component